MQLVTSITIFERAVPGVGLLGPRTTPSPGLRRQLLSQQPSGIIAAPHIASGSRKSLLCSLVSLRAVVKIEVFHAIWLAKRPRSHPPRFQLSKYRNIFACYPDPGFEVFGIRNLQAHFRGFLVLGGECLFKHLPALSSGALGKGLPGCVSGEPFEMWIENCVSGSRNLHELHFS